MLDASPALLLTRTQDRRQGAITLSGTASLATMRDFRNDGEPARVNDLVSIRATGIGSAANQSALSVTVGGIDARVESILPAQDARGIFLINVRIPPAAQPGDAVPVQLEMISSAGRRLQSNQVTLAIE
jgi:uncharacterized protein (TIGR03437 family)